MDRDKLIGFTLIFVILLIYTHFWGPNPTPQAANDCTQPPIASAPSPHIGEDTAASIPLLFNGLLAQDGQEPAREVVLENQDIQVTLTARGGQIKAVTLKNYQDHQRQPLVLLDAQSSAMGFRFTDAEAEVNTHTLSFETTDNDQYVAEGHVGQATFTWTLAPGQYIRHIFSLPSHGYQLTHAWEIVGLEEHVDEGRIDFVWHDLIKRTEKDIKACRHKATINYYLADHAFKHLKEYAANPQEQTIPSPIQWVAIKQRFFTAAIIAEEAFARGAVALTPTPQSTATIKAAQVGLALPHADLQQVRKGKFSFYLGPNDYSLLRGVAPGFSKNLSLGWPIVKWVNQYFIIPLFAFLEQYISNYGLIILMLVIAIKLLLLPLSYRSYLAMAQMKVLKPILDTLKTKYGNDLHKLQMEQIKLYRAAGINPLSGCVPLLLQMPILLAMFNFFPNAIALRQKAFLWAHDLSTYDSILDLPFSIPAYGSHISLFTLLMAVSTLFHTWSSSQSSTPEGPMKILVYLMPIMLLFILNDFPAGLTFYYFVANLATLGQQELIKRFVDEDSIREKLAANAALHSEKSKLQSRLKLAMRAKK